MPNQLLRIYKLESVFSQVSTTGRENWGTIQAASCRSDTKVNFAKRDTGLTQVRIPFPSKRSPYSLLHLVLGICRGVAKVMEDWLVGHVPQLLVV